MPLDRYKSADPFDNHPLFKSEEQARIEDTMDGQVSLSDDPNVLAWAGAEVEAHALVPAEDHESDSGLWSRSRDFDWGD
jgi:hypothetical protein